MRRTTAVVLSPSMIRLFAITLAWGGLPPSIYYALQGRLGWTLPIILACLALVVAALRKGAAESMGRRRFVPQLAILLAMYLAFGALVEIYMAITFVPYSPVPRIPALVHGFVFLGLAISAAWKLRTELAHA